MQRWRSGRPVQIPHAPLPDSEGGEGVFLSDAEHSSCQVVPQLQQFRTDSEAESTSASGLLIKIDIFRSTFSCAETFPSLSLAQVYGPPVRVLVSGSMPSLLFDGEHLNLQAYNNGFLDWLRRLISGKDHAGKDQKTGTRPDEKKPEQRERPAQREGGRMPREPREMDVWE